MKNATQNTGKIRTTAIIGAGPAGLVAAKECLEAGLQPVIFEAKDVTGGVWHPEQGKIWRGMRSLLSRFHCGFSDFPFRCEDMTQGGDFPTGEAIYGYLQDYIAHHGLAAHIRTGTRIEALDYSRQRWHLTTGKTVEPFDSLVIASGIFAQDAIPYDMKQVAFGGTMLHSGTYRDARDYILQDVAVIGGSYSGYEIAADLAASGAQVHHIFRTPAWIMGRYRNTMPFDLATYRYTRPVAAAKREKTRLARLAWIEATYGNPGQDHPALRMDARSPDPCKTIISDHYLPLVRQGRIIPYRDRVTDFSTDRLHLASGQNIKADTVIFCTGYHSRLPSFPLLAHKTAYQPQDMFQPLVLNKATLHPHFPSLAFTGLYRGPYFATMEMQARWAAAIFSGQIKPPDERQHRKALAFEQNLRMLAPEHRPAFPRSDYTGFMLELAAEIGAVPQDLLHSEQPVLPSDFRASGIHADKMLALQGRQTLQQRLDLL